MKARIFSHYNTHRTPNDTYIITLENVDAEPYPMDDIKFKAAGGKCLVGGAYRSPDRAEAVAKEIFSRQYPGIEIR